MDDYYERIKNLKDRVNSYVMPNSVSSGIGSGSGVGVGKGILNICRNNYVYFIPPISVLIMLIIFKMVFAHPSYKNVFIYTILISSLINFILFYFVR